MGPTHPARQPAGGWVGRYPYSPSSSHLAASFPAQMSSFVGKSGSPRYSLMLSLVTATGSSNTDGTSLVPLLMLSVADVGFSPLASAIASSAAASASFLIAL